MENLSTINTETIHVFYFKNLRKRKINVGITYTIICNVIIKQFQRPAQITWLPNVIKNSLSPFHLFFFPNNLGTVNDEQGETLHQDIRTMDIRYQGRWDPPMMANYCWLLTREEVTTIKEKNRIFVFQINIFEICFFLKSQLNINIVHIQSWKISFSQ